MSSISLHSKTRINYEGAFPVDIIVNLEAGVMHMRMVLNMDSIFQTCVNYKVAHKNAYSSLHQANSFEIVAYLPTH